MTIVDPGKAASSNLVARVKGILLTPTTEWTKIDAEPATISGLYRSYVFPLAAIGPVCGLVGSLVFGHTVFGMTYRPPLIGSIVGAIVGYALTLAGVYLMALIIEGLAPTFSGEKSRVQAFKVAAYSATAGWVIAVVGLFPPLIPLSLLGFYSLFLMYLGLPKLMKAPEEKAMGYTALTVVCAVAVWFVIGMVTAPLMLLGGAGSVMSGGPGTVSGTLHVGGATVDMGKLQATAKQLEAAANQMQSGTTSSGAAIKPVAADALKALLPAAVAGFTRNEISGTTAGTAGLGGSNAQGVYAKGDSSITLSVTDIAAAGPLAGIASAFNVESSKETATGYEKMGKVDGRMTNEKYDRQTKGGSYGVMVASRFMIQADGSQVTMDDLKAAVAAVGPDRLEALAR